MQMRMNIVGIGMNFSLNFTDNDKNRKTVFHCLSAG